MEIVCEADVRRAELEGEEKATRPKETAVTLSRVVTHPQVPTRRQSKRAPMLKVFEDDRRAYYAACRQTLEAPTPTGVVACPPDVRTLAHPRTRKAVIGKLGRPSPRLP